MPLILPINVICNTDDNVLHANIRANSRRDLPWLEACDAHDIVAVMVGSGPSMADHVSEIRAMKQSGSTVFAMNGVAKFLHERGIIPDYQVLIDPRPETAKLVGPAKHRLIASQCSPETFDAAERNGGMPILWHLQIEGIDNDYPDPLPSIPASQAAHTEIGGAASVGNSALCLAYAMGYRRFEIYGYDSSNTGEDSHAFRQPMNDGEPMANVDFRGKLYTASLTMKLQAETFMAKTAPALMRLGCTFNVHGHGLLPDMWNAPRGSMGEHEKYSMLWNTEGYRAVSPGELTAQKFVEVVKPKGAVVDFGCGTGRGALAIKRLAGCEVLLCDFVAHCRDRAAEMLPFTQADLTTDRLPVGDHGYCCDVMEHIPPDDVYETLRNILTHVPECFFRIDFEEDECGHMIGERLHLSQHDHNWWLDAFERLEYRVEWSEDYKRCGLFLVTRKGGRDGR